MLLKLLYNDFLKNKIITATLFVFISLSAFLLIAGVNMVFELSGAIQSLFAQSRLPDFVQLYEGSIQPNQISQWAAKNPLVKSKQIVDMLKISGADVYLGDTGRPESNTVMNLYFVMQNKQFDFLPNLHNKIIYPHRGDIGVPIYFMERNHLKIGDKLTIQSGRFRKVFTITEFIRDAQMNPAFVQSKRFVINPSDFRELRQHFGKVVYLIEFQLHDRNQLKQFENAYQNSLMPKNGPILDYHLYQFLNAITDGIVIGSIILISFFLTAIALFCLRFTVHASVEENFKQIGVMKAIGFSRFQIKLIYLLRYIAITAVACVVGLLLALSVNHLLLANMVLYIGYPLKSVMLRIVPYLAMMSIFIVVIGFCYFLLRQFNRISPVMALSQATLGEKVVFRKDWLRLPKRYFNLNIFLGCKDVIQKSRIYILLFCVFIVCAFLMILPVNFYNTVSSPNFVTYMGIGRSDVRVDLSTFDGRYTAQKMMAYIKRDPDVSKYALMTIGRFKVLGQHGDLEGLNIETGNFNVFPVQYFKGHAPENVHQIALSYLSSKKFKKTLGSHMTVLTKQGEHHLIVTGIYQDITNGGQTAKAMLPVAWQNRFWQIINFNFKPNVDMRVKIKQYDQQFSPIRVASLREYMHQTLGSLISHLALVSLVSLLIALSISVLITSLFLKMLIAKQGPQIAVMKLLGFSLNDLYLQYLTRAIFVLTFGIIIGAILVNTLGQRFVSFVWSFMGAPKIQFIIQPMQVYLLYPAMLVVTIVLTALFSILVIKKMNIATMLKEMV